jgi:hypothetical protein
MQTLRSLFVLLVVIGVMYGAYKIALPYYSNTQFEDELTRAAKQLSTSTERLAIAEVMAVSGQKSAPVVVARSEQEVRDDLLRQAQVLRIPISSDSLHFERRGNKVLIWTDYTVVVDLPGYPVNLHFRAVSKTASGAM